MHRSHVKNLSLILLSAVSIAVVVYVSGSWTTRTPLGSSVRRLLNTPFLTRESVQQDYPNAENNSKAFSNRSNLTNVGNGSKHSVGTVLQGELLLLNRLLVLFFLKTEVLWCFENQRLTFTLYDRINAPLLLPPLALLSTFHTMRVLGKFKRKATGKGS